MTLEAALGIGLVLSLAVLLLHVLAFGRDLLLVQEAARAGARVAATTTSDGAVARAVRASADGLPVQVSVTPTGRRAGDIARVQVRWQARIGPLRRLVTGQAVARVEPGVGLGAGRRSPGGGWP